MAVSAIAVKCPIFLPGRASIFPYKCTFTRGSASAAAQFGVPPSHTSPSKFAIAAGLSISVDPSGKLHTARNCCSNWLVTDASNVKCPELCGRGASSFTSNFPDFVRKNSTHNTPTTASESKIARAISTASFRVASGKSAGDTLKVTVAPEEAYGVRDESLTQTAPKSAFQSPNIAVGQQFRADSPQGQRVFTVTKIEGDTVTVDGNHPLAGIALNFEVTIKDVRAASQEEIAHGHVHGPGGHHHH